MDAGAGLTGNHLFPRFSDQEYARRGDAVREAMAREGLDAILISGARGSSEVHYLANYLAQSPCWLLFPRQGDPTLFIHFFNHQPCARAQSVIADVRWYGPAPVPTLVKEMETRGLAKARIGDCPLPNSSISAPPSLVSVGCVAPRRSLICAAAVISPTSLAKRSNVSSGPA
jgi:hypothetical protein